MISHEELHESCIDALDGDIIGPYCDDCVEWWGLEIHYSLDY